MDSQHLRGQCLRLVEQQPQSARAARQPGAVLRPLPALCHQRHELPRQRWRLLRGKRWPAVGGFQRRSPRAVDARVCGVRRVGTLQDRNTLLMTYAGRPGMHRAKFVKDKVHRASAAMFLFRWTDGTDGLFVNRELVRNLPRELAPGDWWFIEDGDVYAAVRPLEATRLRGGKTMLEKRTRHVVLYQDNVAANNITGIADADWIKARSGFVVEMGDKSEFDPLPRFRTRSSPAKSPPMKRTASRATSPTSATTAASTCAGTLTPKNTPRARSTVATTRGRSFCSRPSLPSATAAGLL